MYRGAESDDTQAKRRHIRVNATISGSPVNSPQPMSSLCLARPLKRRELLAISVVTTAVFRGAKRRHAKPFIAHQVQQWLSDKNIKAIYIDPDSPWLPSEATPQRAIARITNGYIESFHARFRQECLNREQLGTLTEARVVIEDWRWLYNNVRPHRSLGNITPRRFAENAYKQGSGSIRATPSLRQDLSYTSILKPLTPGNSLSL